MVLIIAACRDRGTIASKLREFRDVHHNLWGFSQCSANFFGAGRRQVIFAGHDPFSGLGFQFQPGAFGNLSAGLCGV